MNRRRRMPGGRVSKRSNFPSPKGGTMRTVKTKAGNTRTYNDKYVNKDGSLKRSAIIREMERRGAYETAQRFARRTNKSERNKINVFGKGNKK